MLTQEQFTKAFNTGRSSKDARIQNSAARQRGEGKVYFGQDVDYGGERYKAASEDMVSSAELDVIKTLAKITGADVVFYQSEADMSGRYKGANGFMRNGTMYLDVNAGANRTSEESAVLLTAAHELTHYIRENNAEGYAQLRDFVTRHLIEDGADIEALAEQKAARENGLLSMDEAVEEVIADSCEMMLEDTQLPEIMAKENPGLYEQIREWIANFAEKLRKAFTGVEARHAEAKAMMKYADELSRIWDSALAGAVKNTEAAPNNGTTAPNNGTKSSIRRTQNMTLKEQLKEYYAGKFQSSDSFYFGETPSTLNVIGIESVPLAMPMNSFRKAATNKHNIPRRVINKLQDNLKAPVLSFYDETTAGILIDDIDGDGKPVLVAINKNANMDRQRVNEIKSIYGLDNPDAWIENQRKTKKFYAFNEARAESFLQTYSSNTTVGETINSRKNSISQSGEESNTKYSMRDVAEDDTADERRGRQESYADLKRRNAELERRAEYWKGQTRTTKEATVRKADTDALARRLTEEMYNKDAADTVKEELKRMGDYIVQTDGQELSYAELKDWASAIADHILSGSETEIESGMEDARRELLDYLKSNKLKINEREMLDLPEGWKREHRRIRFGKDGLPIDTAWMELQEKFGEGAFPSDITSQSDMLFRIAELERAWQPVRGGDTRTHRNVTSWDYTVRIDGRMYDVLTNIRKTSDDSCVYSIQKNTRKTNEAALPRKAHSQEGKSFQKRACATSI